MEWDVYDDLSIMASAMDVSISALARLSSIPPSTVSRGDRKISTFRLSTLDKIYNAAYLYPPHPVRLNQIKAQLAQDMFGDCLFHGASKMIAFPLDLDHSRSNLDLGKGVYLAESYETAASYVSKYSYPFVYGFRKQSVNALKIKEYEVGLDWMLVVSLFRGDLNEYASCPKLLALRKEVEEADIVIAPIADNNMFRIITRFSRGEITDKQASMALSASNLGKQYVYRTSKALDSLQCVETYFLCEEERKDLTRLREEKKAISADKAKLSIEGHRREGRYIEEILK